MDIIEACNHLIKFARSGIDQGDFNVELIDPDEANDFNQAQDILESFLRHKGVHTYNLEKRIAIGDQDHHT